MPYAGGRCFLSISVVAQSGGTPSPKQQEAAEVKACAEMAFTGFRPIADTREQRFQGKVTELIALCRGGLKAVQFRMTPWVDFTNYWGTGDMSSLPKGYLSTSAPQFRGVSGALLDLEYQRIELIKFNLFDNNGTYQDYVAGRGGVDGRGDQDLAGDAAAAEQSELRSGRRRWRADSARAT